MSLGQFTNVTVSKSEVNGDDIMAPAPGTHNLALFAREASATQHTFWTKDSAGVVEQLLAGVTPVTSGV